MDVKQLYLNDAVGHILLHNYKNQQGRKVVGKGRALTVEDITVLKELGVSQVYVAILAQDDVPEDSAAHRLGSLLQTEGITITRATTGRVNLIADTAGLVTINIEALLALNNIDGITLATVANHTVVHPKKVLATLKIIPYAVPEKQVQQAEAVLKTQQPLLGLKPFTVPQAMLITTGSPVAQTKVMESFTPPLQERLANYQTKLIAGPYVAETVEDISLALQKALADGMPMILIAGETSVMDVNDIMPQAIKSIGGNIVHHGVPVEPGNLFLLAYHGDVPIVGAPGCARSKNWNVVDLILPRLVTGERLKRADLLTLGHGGYLK